MSVANAKHTVLNPVRRPIFPVLLTARPRTRSSRAAWSRWPPSHSVAPAAAVMLLITVPSGGPIHWAHTRRPAPGGDHHYPGHCASRR